MNRDAARTALARGWRLMCMSRPARILRQPLKAARGRVLRATGGVREAAMPTFWGGRFDGVLPEPVSTMIWRYGFIDRPVCLALLDRLPAGGVLVDVGAHFGFFTLLGSALAGPEGRVVAVEAMPATRARLEANIARNAAQPNVSVAACAAFDAETVLEFRDFGVLASSLNSAFAARRAVAGEGAAVAVPARPLDAVLAEAGIGRVDVVKIDAESSEVHVLDGMARLAGACRPTIVVEAAAMTPEQRAHSERVDTWLAARGYRGWRYAGETLTPAGPIAAIRYDNLVYLPEEAPAP